MIRRTIPSIYAVRDKSKKPKVVFGIPLPKGQIPHKKTIESLENCLPAVEAAGWEHGLTHVTGPYISGGRAELTRKGMDAKADAMVYIDYDVSWDPQDIVKLLTTEGDVVAGTYRCKTDDPDEILYMGAIFNDPVDFKPIGRGDGCIKAKVVPAGFLKVTAGAIDMFMRAYPDLCYGPQYSLSIDLFHHGAHAGLWWGEDYAFSRNYLDAGGEIWLVPDMNIDHWQGESVYKGNYHKFLLSQPGGIEDPARLELVNG